MKELVVLSGKGGTGKTSVCAAFAHLAVQGQPSVRAVIADADVDAANLELVLAPRTLEAHEFVGGSVAVIDGAVCRGCGICADVCRLDACHPLATTVPARPAARPVYVVDAMACEGCAACLYQCPEQAIRMAPRTAGQWFRSESRYGPLFHAALRPAQENSGKLVTLVKRQARLYATEHGYEALIVDGPPGIGCPVISAVSGADLALVVTEPTAAGVHDVTRALALTAQFRVQTLVCVNKFDVHEPATAAIVGLCHDHEVAVVGHVPFDAAVTEAMVHGQAVTAYEPESPAAGALRDIWHAVAGWLCVEAG